MASLNKTAKGEKKVTHGGALASHISVARELERTVMAHMLFEAFTRTGKVRQSVCLT